MFLAHCGKFLWSFGKRKKGSLYEVILIAVIIRFSYIVLDKARDRY